MTPRCDECDGPDECECDNCAQNAAERAWERHCEAFHDGGASGWTSLVQQQADARRLK